MISTRWPERTPPCSRTACSAAKPEIGTTAACSKVTFPGFGKRRSARATAYSAKDPRHVPNTSCPGRNSVTWAPTASMRPATVVPEQRVLRGADPEARKAHRVRRPGHQVPYGLVDARCVHMHQHVHLARDWLVNVRESQSVDRAVSIPNDRLHERPEASLLSGGSRCRTSC